VGAAAAEPAAGGRPPGAVPAEAATRWRRAACWKAVRMSSSRGLRSWASVGGKGEREDGECKPNPVSRGISYRKTQPIAQPAKVEYCGSVLLVSAPL